MLACAPVAFTFGLNGRILRLLLLGLLQSLPWALLLCVPAMLIKGAKARKIYCLGCGAAVGLLALPDAACIAMTGASLTADTLTAALETGPTESRSFFSQYLTVGAIARLMLFYLLAAAVSFGTPLLLKRIRPQRLLEWCLLAATAVGVCLSFPLWKGAVADSYPSYLEWQAAEDRLASGIHLDRVRFADIPAKWINLMAEMRLRDAEIDRWETRQIRFANSDLSDSFAIPDGWEPPFDIVVIIGESFIRSHSSLYGYPRPVNPRLKAEADSGRLTIFTDMVTTANFTTPSLRNLLNLRPDSARFGWPDGLYLPLILKKAGWHMAHFDNQTAPTSGSDFGLARMLYSPKVAPLTYDLLSDSTFRYDGDFVRHVNTRLLPAMPDGRRAVFYHLWGQHFAAADRYPGPGHFRASDIKSDAPWLTDADRRAIADYDNATLYNDSVVGAIIDRWRSRPAMVIYLSDHGEDSPWLTPVAARNVQQPNDPAWIERQYAIPFMVWLSDSLLLERPDLADRLSALSTRPLTLADFSTLLLSLADLLPTPEATYLPSSLPPSLPRVSVGGYETNPPPAKLPAGD